MHSEGSDRTTNILVYPNTNTSQCIDEKKEKVRLNKQQQFTYATHFSITFHFYFLLRFFISGWLLKKRRLSLSGESMSMQLEDNLTI